MSGPSESIISKPNAHGRRAESTQAVVTAGSLCDQQSEDWSLGRQRPVEHYLAAQPESVDESLLLDLIYNEVLQRERIGERPSDGEYCERFPRLAESIRRMFEVHQFVNSDDAIRRFGNKLDGDNEDTKRPRDASDGSPAALHHLEGYQIIAPIGRGAMGIVYEARQEGTNRRVAVKVLYSSGKPTVEEASRFSLEAQAAARLNHPSIVSVHEAGSRGGVHFLAMDLIEGETLAQRLSQGNLRPREAAALIMEVARAVHYAHASGVIHRDLKPHNILLDGDGKPHIADFGLARFRDHESTWTTSGQILGTLSYMSPEQAIGNCTNIGFSVDIYGLGAVLYHALAGRPALVGDSVPRLLYQLIHEEPPRPSAVVDSIPLDLETICLK